jgi:YbgC/YbaW family acyl-CoA thioester hydrolase
MISEYRLKRRVQFYETDAAGIVHFSWYFRYIEEAEHALWREAGLSIFSRASDIHWPRVAATCDFHAALSFEQEFEVWIRIAAMTPKTIRYTCQLANGDMKIATATMTVACVLKRPNEPMRSATIPPEIAQRFQVAPGAE